jgi:hypothetical protein
MYSITLLSLVKNVEKSKEIADKGTAVLASTEEVMCIQEHSPYY